MASPEAPPVKRHIDLRHWLTLLPLSALLVISRFHHPEPNPAVTLCGFRMCFGLPCPACGLTRSFCALAKGELAAGFFFNQLGPLLFAIAILFWLAALAALLGWRKPFEASVNVITNVRFIKAAIIITIVYWVARTIFLLATSGISGTLGKGLLAQIWH